MADDKELLEGEKTRTDAQKEENEIETELEEVLDSVPPEHRETIKRMISFQMGSFSASPEATVMKKLTPEHISMFLAGSEQEMKNSYAEKLHKKIFTLLTTILAMIFLIVIIVLLKDKPDIMENVLYTIGGVIAGAFGGYGLGRNRNED